MPKNALAPQPSNSLVFDPFERRYKLRTTPTGAVAENVDAALIPALMRAHFPEFMANSRATVSDAPIDMPGVHGEYRKSSFSRGMGPVILTSPRITGGESNSLTMQRAPGGGYVGVGGNNATTDAVMNALSTMLHESYHARMQPDFFHRRNPSDDLRQRMSKDRYENFMDSLKISGLPSVARAQSSDSHRLNEFLSTAVPTRLMQAKGIQSSEAKYYAQEVKRLESLYPEIRGFISDWVTPENKPASFNLF
jgi:hypothetical protein